MNNRQHANSRRGFTLLEVLIGIAVIGLLAALIVPAVQATRNSNAKLGCKNHLKQMGIAVERYHLAHRVYPRSNSHSAHSLHVLLLPYLEEKNLYAQFDFTKPAFTDKTLHRAPPVYLCPADYLTRQIDSISYVANAGTVGSKPNDGFFVHSGYRKSGFTAADIGDTLSATTMISESLVSGHTKELRRGVHNFITDYDDPDSSKLRDRCLNEPLEAKVVFGKRGLRWHVSAHDSVTYAHTMPPNGRHCQYESSVTDAIYSATSNHPGGVNVLFGDGHVKFVNDGISLVTWRAWGTRSGGETAETP